MIKIAVNLNKLKGKIVEKGFNIKEVADLMERNQSTIYRKLNGDCPITIEEAGMLVNILNLSVLESYEIFFNQTVANTLQIQGGDLN